MSAAATASKLFTGDPNTVMTIRRITPNLTTFSVPFSRFGLIKFGGRATLAKMQSGSLAVFSAVSLTPAVQAEVDAMGGNVAYIVAPDMEHHLYLGPWKKAFPAAKVIAPALLREKRAKQNDEDVTIDFAYTGENKAGMALPTDFTDTFEVEFFHSHANQEVAVLHKAEKTLIEADLLFNLPAREQYSKTNENPSGGFFTKLFMYFTTIGGKGQQRFNWYAAAKDKPSFATSARRVAGWDFERIIPCHGDVIETGGNAIFRQVFAWHLEANH